MDGHKLLYRAAAAGGGGGRGAAGGGGAAPAPALFIVDADRQPPQAGAGRIELSARLISATAHPIAAMVRDGRFNDDLFEGSRTGGQLLCRSLRLRSVVAGSCNGCSSRRGGRARSRTSESLPCCQP